MIKKIGSFWVLILGCVLLGIFCSANRDWITVTIPYVSEVRVRAAEVYLWSFVMGAAVTFIFFFLELTRKSITIRKLNKKLKDLESHNTAQVDAPVIANEKQIVEEKEDLPSPQLEAVAGHETTIK